NLREIRAGCARTAFDHVAGDADAVGRSEPGKIDLRGRSSAGGEVCWCSRWSGIRRGCGHGGRDRGESAEIACGIAGVQTIGIGSRSSQPGVVESRCGGRDNLREIRAGCALAAFHHEIGRAHVVGRSGPGKVDLASGGSRHSQVHRRGGWRGVWRGSRGAEIAAADYKSQAYSRECDVKKIAYDATSKSWVHVDPQADSVLRPRCQEALPAKECSPLAEKYHGLDGAGRLRRGKCPTVLSDSGLRL